MKQIVPVEVLTCQICKRKTFKAPKELGLPESDIEIRSYTVGSDKAPLRSLTLCDDDFAPYKSLFDIAAEQGLPPENAPTLESSKPKVGDCEYCGRKGYQNLLSHWVAVHPDKAPDRCTLPANDGQLGTLCNYPFFTERSKRRHLKVTHGIEDES